MNWPEHFSQGNHLAHTPLAELTTFRIGGPAHVLTLERVEDLDAALAVHPKWVLGKGANILVSDDGCQRPVLRLGRQFSATQWVEEGLLRVGAAHDLALLIGRCCREGWGGLEGLSGVPATVGGALCMNAGTASRWFFDCVERVQVLLPNEGVPVWIERGKTDPVYRSSGFPAGTFFIGCELRLSRGEPEELLATARAMKAAKAASQPLSAASAGCIFKNPSPEMPAGRLVEELGLKGMRLGGAQISEVHGNFIINTGNARASEVAALVRRIRARAQEERGISLAMEIQLWDLDAELFEPQAEDLSW